MEEGKKLNELRGGELGAMDCLRALDPPTELPDPALSDNGASVLERRYLRRDAESGEVVETARQCFWRVASHVAEAELKQEAGTPEAALAIAGEYYSLMAERRFMPNSPTLMNAGRAMGMLSACFVLPVEDSIEDIFESIKATALIQKAGGGTGFSFSRLRPSGDLVSTSGGRTEGPLSFIEVFSKATEAIQQGAFRRGANMGVLHVEHPDIIRFIKFKDDLTKIQNYNVSVAIGQRFLDQLGADRDAPHRVQNPRNGKWSELFHERAGESSDRLWTVGEVWDLIIQHAWRSGEPGLVFLDRINEKNPIKNVGLIEATNPCGEQPLHPYDSCNLGSINLGCFVSAAGDAAPGFDWEELKSVVHTCTRFLDDVIEVNRYPLPEIDQMSKTTRRIGLGVMGFADALFALGLAYNSEEACEFGREVMRVIETESHMASEGLAEERGVFPAWIGSEWEERGRPMRNSYTTTVAPTGTISILADCSGGIEPMFSLAFTRRVMKDKDGKPTVMTEVNRVFESVAKQAGFYSDELIDDIRSNGSLQHRADLDAETKRIFVTAHDIEPEWHMRMQAAFQEHCDSSISKTINFSHDATPDDVREIYELAIQLDVKGVTVYRDGCREMQPMALTPQASREAAVDSAPAALVPIRLPEIMPSLRIRQMTPFGNMHVKVTVDAELGVEREVFAQLGKGGDVANSDLEAICRLLSLWLRVNGELRVALKQLAGIGSSLTVPTKDGRIMSLADGLAKALDRYLRVKEEYGLEALLLGRVPTDVLNNHAPKGSQLPRAAGGDRRGAGIPRGSYKLKCPSCAESLAFEEGCAKCYSCGFSQC